MSIEGKHIDSPVKKKFQAQRPVKEFTLIVSWNIKWHTIISFLGGVRGVMLIVIGVDTTIRVQILD